MADLVQRILPELRKNQLPGLGLGDDLIQPAYEGYSILNLPTSICRWFGAAPIGAVPLSGMFGELANSREFKRVILVVIDALTLERFQHWIADGTAPVWNTVLQGGCLAPLTSITPSTTSAAITTLWTGRSPTEHGITGYEMWFKEYGVSGNTILHSVMSFANDPDGLERAGYNPEEALALPVMGSHLADYGVKTVAMQHASIIHSGLSRTILKDVRLSRYFTAADLWTNLRELLERDSVQRTYAYVYWSEIDTLSHMYGPDDERTKAEFWALSAAMERNFLNKLSPAARKDTLLVLTADHGAVATNPDPYYDLRNHPNLVRRLHMHPTGESRLAYLYIRPGQTEAVREYFERTWPNQFYLIESTCAMEHGLFGPGEKHPALHDRVGDYIAIARGSGYLWWVDKENNMLGRHGGMSSQEMIVPLLYAPL